MTKKYQALLPIPALIFFSFIPVSSFLKDYNKLHDVDKGTIIQVVYPPIVLTLVVLSIIFLIKTHVKNKKNTTT